MAPTHCIRNVYCIENVFIYVENEVIIRFVTYVNKFPFFTLSSTTDFVDKRFVMFCVYQT